MEPGDPGMSDGRLYPLRGSVVKRLRLEKGWSRQMLADKIGRSKKTVENIERRITKPVYYETLDKLAKAFDVEPRTLLAIPAVPEANGRSSPGEIPVIASSHPPKGRVSPQSINILCETSIGPGSSNRIMSECIEKMYNPIKQIADAQETTSLGEPVFYLLREDLKEEVKGGRVRLHFLPSKGENGKDVWAVAAISENFYDEYVKGKEYGCDLSGGLPFNVLIVALGRGEPSDAIQAILEEHYGAVDYEE